MSSPLRPGYSLTLGTQRLTEQVLALSLSLAAAPQADILHIVLPSAIALDPAPDAPVTLDLDAGVQAGQVFAGAIMQIRHGIDTIRITAMGGAGRLARLRPATTYREVTAGTVIRELAAAAGAQAGRIDDGAALAFYVADPARSALDHVARLAGFSGAMARFSAADRLEVNVVGLGAPDMALRQGRDILSHQDHRRGAADGATVAGESGAGSVSAPEALRPTTDFFAGNRPAGPGAGQRWRFEPALRTAQAAATASAALNAAHANARAGGSLLALLHPELRPGTAFEIQDAPDRFGAGICLATAVIHSLARTGATSRIRYERIASEGLAGLAARALGAISSLV